MNLALFNALSVDDVTVTLSVGVTLANVAIKDLIFAYKRANIEKLWNRLADIDFRAKVAEELKCGNFYDLILNLFSLRF